jgi:glycopeptide antibiotics resistance protein
MAANKNTKKIQWVCFMVYLLFLVNLLFLSPLFGRTEFGEGEYRYNLTLFQEIGRYYNLGITKGSWTLFIYNVIGNIVVFMPLSIFLRLLVKRCKRVFYTILLCLEFSLFAEIVQLVTKVGSFDVDDLLLNTFGGICGIILLAIWRAWHGRKKNL